MGAELVNPPKHQFALGLPLPGGGLHRSEFSMEIYFVRLARLSTPDSDTVTASTGSASDAWTADLIIFVGMALATYGVGMIR